MIALIESLKVVAKATAFCLSAFAGLLCIVALIIVITK